MDFHQLRVFSEVARLKNFSRAAEKLFLTQPTVSAHIKSLENEIGAPLLDRSQRELRLTGVGQILYQYAQQLLNLEKQASHAIQQENQVIKGHLEVAASSIPSAYLLPGLMKGFLAQYPDVTFAVIHRDTQQVFACIRDFTCDLGFVGEPVPGAGLEQIKLVADNLILAAAPATKLPGEKPLRNENEKPDPGQPQLYDLDIQSFGESFLGLPFIMREPGSATRVVFEAALKKHYGKKAPDLNVVAYLESQEAIKEAVKIGLGLTVISQRAVQAELSAGQMKGYRLPALQLERNLYLIYRRNSVFSPLCAAFREHCLSALGVEKQKPGPKRPG